MKWQYGLLAAFAVAACSGAGDNSTGGGDDQGGSNPDFTVAADLAAAPDQATLPNGYPAGPYGTGVGDTIEDFTFQGYYSPTRTTGLSSTETYGAISMNTMRTTPGGKFLLFWFAGFT